MKLLVPAESRRAARVRKTRRRRSVVFAVLGILGIVTAGFYLFPQRMPPRGDIYQNTDSRVLQSLVGFRGDYATRRIDVGGRIWSYVRLGDQPETVLFLHGMGGAYDIWWQQIRALMDRYSVIAVSYPDESTLEGAALALRSVLDQEGVGEAHVVGTSMGGYVAQYLATVAPDRVSSLVLGNTFPPGEWIEEEYGTLINLLPVLPGWVPQRSFRKNVEESIFPASGGSHLVRSYLLEQSYMMSKADFRARAAVLLETFAVPDLASLGIPAVIIEADNDPLVPVDVRAQLTESYADVPVVTLNEVGHFPYLNRPAAYTRILEEFWGSLRGDVPPLESGTPASDPVETEPRPSVASSNPSGR